MSGGIFWLASFPKSGNTWMRAFIANLLDEKEEAADINELHVGGMASGRGWLDEELGFDTAELSHDEIDWLRPAVYRRRHQELTEFCYCKCHDAWTLLPDGSPLFPPDAACGALYLLRNPLDVAVSYAHHCTVDLDKATAMMCDRKAVFCAADHRLTNQVRQKLLDWSSHVQSWVDAPGLNVLPIRYEDMRLHPLPTFSQAAKFLRLPADPERIQTALARCDFTRLRQQPRKSKPFSILPTKVLSG